MTTVTNVAEFNAAIAKGVDSITISGDIATNSKFDLNGKNIVNLTIDLAGMSNGDALTLTNGSVTNLTVIDKAGVLLTIENVLVQSSTSLN